MNEEKDIQKENQREKMVVETPKVQKSVQAQTNVKKKQTVVYVGPDIKNVVKKNTIFNNGLTKGLQKKMDEIPLIGGLLIPVEQLADANVQLSKKGSVLNTLYERVKKMIYYFGTNYYFEFII